MNTEQKDERSIFMIALKLRDSGKRAAYLKEACGDDADLLSRVEALLVAHDKTLGTNAAFDPRHPDVSSSLISLLNDSDYNPHPAINVRDGPPSCQEFALLSIHFAGVMGRSGGLLERSGQSTSHGLHLTAPQNPGSSSSN